MAAINRNIQTGNFIPGSEEYTRPEEISIMGKYLRAGIKNLTDTLNVDGAPSSGIANKAVIKNIKELPGEETLEGINNTSGNIKSLSKVRESIQKQEEKIRLDKNKELLDTQSNLEDLKDNFEQSKSENLEINTEKISLDKERYTISNKKDIILPKQKETIDSNESGSGIDVVNSTLYEKLYNENPKVDKRTLPDSENKDPKFKNLDTFLGGVHYDKYSSETLSRSTTPTKDAVLASSTGTSDTIFVKPEELNKKEVSLSESLEEIKNKKIVESLDRDFSELKKDNKLKELVSSKEILKKSEDKLNLDNTFQDLQKSTTDISLSESFSELKKKDPIELDNDLSELVNKSPEIQLSGYSEDIESTIIDSLSEDKDELNKDPRKLALSKYVDKLLDGKISSLSEQKESLPDELKNIILIDYLKDTIKNDKELKLAIDNLQDMPGEEKDIILDNFVGELNKDLKKLISLNEKYFTKGKEVGVENLLNDVNDLISSVFNSQYFDELDIPEHLLSLSQYFESVPKLPESKGPSAEFDKQLSSLYGISRLTAEELRKTLDELTGCCGNWGKKVSAYLSTLLGKYKNFKKYISKEDVSRFKEIVEETYDDDRITSKKLIFIEDINTVTMETFIRYLGKFLKNVAQKRAYLGEILITKYKLKDAIRLNSTKHMYEMSLNDVEEQEYGDRITLKGTYKSIKTELIDNTWNSIKSWFTSSLSNSLFGATANLLTEKSKLPGHDYSYDTTIRNIPNVSGFYDKKTSTKSFSGSPHSTPMEISSTNLGSSGWFTRALSKTKEYTFKDNYLLGEGVQLTLKDLCGIGLNQISTVEDLFDTLKNSEKTTAHARTSEGVMNGMTLSSNHVWEITIEPYISRFNGYRTWLPFFQELNQLNYKKHRVRTIYDKWIPVTSFELQDKRLINKTLGLYAGEISYPIAMEYSNELRLTIADDSFKSFRYYFDKVAELSTYESLINTETDRSSAYVDANFAKNRKFNSFIFKKYGNNSKEEYNSTFDTVNKNKFAVGMYKNLCFNICIYIMTPQYSTIKKYNLLCVMKDYSIEYSGETDASPSDVSVNFSIVGETNEYYEYDKFREDSLGDLDQVRLDLLNEETLKKINEDLDKKSSDAMDNMYTELMNRKQTRLSVINNDPYDYETVESLGMMNDGYLDRTSKIIYNPQDETQTKYLY